MKRFASTVVAALVLLPAAALAHPAGAHREHGAETASGRPVDPARGGRVIPVLMTETAGGMAFTPARIEVTRGEQVRFVLRNRGELDHELVIGTVEENLRHAAEMAERPDMEHEDPNAKRLKPGTAGVLRWQFTKPGTFEYACLIPGHREAGMVGMVFVN